MKKICLIFFLCLFIANAKEQKLVKSDFPQENYPNLSLNSCDKNCLLELLEARLYLSFLCEFVENNDEFLSNVYAKLLNSITDFDSNLQKITAVKLAIIIPEKTLKSYSNIIINASLAYLLRQRAEIKVKVFLIGTEDNKKIQETLSQIEAQNYAYVIAGFTLKGANALSAYNGNLKIFIPTLNKNTSQIQNQNIYFGGIDYDAQIAKLLENSNANIAVFTDNSSLASNLNTKILKQKEQSRFFRIESEKINFQNFLRTQGGLRQASIFFNTPLIKTALISSQLRVHNINPYILLSTQINYAPAFLSLTQANDRKNFLIANSIDKNDTNLNYLNEIFNQNLDYNWVAYATSVGIDYFYTQFLNTQSERIFEEKIQDSQFIYKIRLMKALEGNFEELQ
ncbi:hypothetical protein [Campylobacter cuniculorum]|uniref:hypothetical protein n=1 Tax=Campylobacter cuniculorum TaxID=374106 RepID=UPI0023F1598E|nr:hypothetical protein [Campylobacter cuniculorum]